MQHDRVTTFQWIVLTVVVIVPLGLVAAIAQLQAWSDRRRRGLTKPPSRIDLRRYRW